MKFPNIFRYKLYGLLTSSESVFENMGTGFSSLEIPQEPNVRENLLKYIVSFEIP